MNVNIIILQTLRAVKREFAFHPPNAELAFLRMPHSELFRRFPARTNASAGLYPAGTNAAAAHYLLSYEAEERIAATARNNAFKRKRRSRLSGLSSRCGGGVLSLAAFGLRLAPVLAVLAEALRSECACPHSSVVAFCLRFTPALTVLLSRFAFGSRLPSRFCCRVLPSVHACCLSRDKQDGLR